MLFRSNIDVDSIDLYIGDIKYLQPIYDNVSKGTRDEYYQDIIWSSSDESIVTIDSKGKLKAIGAGEAYVRVKVKYTKKESKIKIKVKYDESSWKCIDKGINGGSSDKDFVVIFSKDLKSTKRNKDNIYISKDTKGNDKSIVSPLIEGNKVIFSADENGWDKNTEYYIFIKKGTQSVNGEQINKNLRYKFKVK